LVKPHTAAVLTSSYCHLAQVLSGVLVSDKSLASSYGPANRFFRSNRISNRIGRIPRSLTDCRPSVFCIVTNESDVRTTELRTENLFISIQS